MKLLRKLFRAILDTFALVCLIIILIQITLLFLSITLMARCNNEVTGIVGQYFEEIADRFKG